MQENHMSKIINIWVFFFVFNFQCAFSLYFHIGETEQKCFYEDLGNGTQVIGYYKVKLFDPTTGDSVSTSPGIGMHVNVKNPYYHTILSEACGLEGSFTFISQMYGDHVICLYPNLTIPGQRYSGTQLRVHLDIRVGEHAIDYTSIIHKEKLTRKELRVQQLLNQLDQFMNEMLYHRYREIMFRHTNESINRRIIWWSLLQSCIFIILSIWIKKQYKSFEKVRLSIQTIEEYTKCFTETELDSDPDFGETGKFSHSENDMVQYCDFQYEDGERSQQKSQTTLKNIYCSVVSYMKPSTQSKTDNKTFLCSEEEENLLCE